MRSVLIPPHYSPHLLLKWKLYWHQISKNLNRLINLKLTLKE